jgi:hypothetical protein
VKRHLLASAALVLVLATPAGAQSVQTWQYANINTTATTTRTLLPACSMKSVSTPRTQPDGPDLRQHRSQREQDRLDYGIRQHAPLLYL